jgi:hypothetical protein
MTDSAHSSDSQTIDDIESQSIPSSTPDQPADVVTTQTTDSSRTALALIQSNVPVPPIVQTNAAIAALPKSGEYIYPEYQYLGKNKAKGVTGTIFWASLQVFNALEYVGEVFADFFGLYDSQYEHIVRSHQRHQQLLEQEHETSQVRQSDDESVLEPIGLNDISVNTQSLSYVPPSDYEPSVSNTNTSGQSTESLPA